MRYRSNTVRLGGYPRHSHLRRSGIDERVSSVRIQEVKIKEPENKYVLFVDYVKDFGDPSTNGLGHTRCVWKGSVGDVWGQGSLPPAQGGHEDTGIEYS